eukprot:scaffold34596_cov222-Amphora_coffeaeformis.AAC.3
MRRNFRVPLLIARGRVAREEGTQHTRGETTRTTNQQEKKAAMLAEQPKATTLDSFFYISFGSLKKREEATPLTRNSTQQPHPHTAATSSNSQRTMVFGLFGNNDNGSKEEETSASKEASRSGAPGFQTTPGCTALVTGSSGLCGARLVEMLLERGAKTVICFDMAEPDPVLSQRFSNVQTSTGGKLILCHGTKDGNLTNKASVQAAFEKAPKIDVVYHIAALVGPFHDKDKYAAVNYEGTLTIIDMCKKYKVPRLV